MNQAQLIGNLGKDPEMNYTPNGTAVTKFSLAVNRRTKDNDGQRRDETDWFNIVCWDKLAETMNQYLHKGSKVFIQGRISQRKYTDKSGVERWMTEIIANDIEMLSPKGSNGGESSTNAEGAVRELSDDEPF